MNNSEFISMLRGFITKAFDNEAEFLAEFWNGQPDDELYELHMAGSGTKFSVMDKHGKVTTYVIGTATFMDWCDSING